MKWLWAFLLTTFPLSASADDLRVITSFPPIVSKAYQDLWVSQNSGSDVLVLNKNTVAAMDEILRGNARGFDVFMASSPEAFEILARNQFFAAPEACESGHLKTVEPFALSSVGWTRRRESDLFLPGDWNDLLNPIYQNKIAMARPARSGTTHLMIEQLLQTRGWTEGWAYVLSLAGNLSTLTARSFGVPDGVEQGRFEIGLTIDFLAQSRADKLDFRYGRPIMLTSARIGILRNGRNVTAACDFLKMVLSEEGQRLLLRPEISRIPIDPKLRSQSGQTPEAIIDTLKIEWITYDAGLSSSRYWAVNALFDVMITEVLNERKDLWARLNSLEAVVDASILQGIRSSLINPMATEGQIQELSAHTTSDLRSTRLIAANPSQSALLETWRSSMRDILKKADQELTALEREQR